MANILVTCVGSGVGQSVVDSLVLSREQKIIGCDTNRNVFGNHFCHKFFVVPTIYSDEYLPFILDICKNEKVDIVIPGHDHELLILSKNISIFNDNNIEVIVSLPDIIEVSRDKYQWYKYFTAFGCSIVPTFRVGEFKVDPDKSILPAIVKPSGGSASQGIRILNSFDELDALNDEDIIQPYLFPVQDDPNFETIQKMVKKEKFVQMSEVSMQLIFTKNTEFAGIFISKNVLKNGVPVHVDPIKPEEFEYLDEIMKFVPVCIEKGVVGPVNIQGRITDKGLVCFEMNMRFTGITGNRAQLGFNEVDFLVDSFLGISGKLDGYALHKYGVRQVGCTTIARSKKKPSSGYSYCILGGMNTIGNAFVGNLMQSGLYTKVFLVCSDDLFDIYQKHFSKFRDIQIIKESDKFTESAYSQSDILINCIGALASNHQTSMYNSIFFLQRQVNRIIRSKIPFVLNISSQMINKQSFVEGESENDCLETEKMFAFQKEFTELMFDSIHEHSPSSKVVSLNLPHTIDATLLNTGPGGFFIKVIQSIKQKHEMQIHKPLHKIHLIDIQDACSAIHFIINSEKRDELPDHVNVPGTHISLRDYCILAADCLQIPIEETRISISSDKGVNVNSSADDSVLNALGWTKQIKLKDTIIKIIDVAN